MFTKCHIDCPEDLTPLRFYAQAIEYITANLSYFA